MTEEVGVLEFVISKRTTHLFYGLWESWVRSHFRELTGYELIYSRDLEDWLMSNYPFSVDYVDHKALAGVAPMFDSGYGGHKWYLLRDVIRLMPTRVRCIECGRRENQWHSTRSWKFGSHPAIPICGDDCVDKRLNRIRRRELKRKRERRCINQGKKKLRQIRAYLKHPNEHQDPSRLLPEASGPGRTSLN